MIEINIEIYNMQIYNINTHKKYKLKYYVKKLMNSLLGTIREEKL